MYCKTLEKTGFDLGPKTTSTRPVVSSTRAHAGAAFQCECVGPAKMQCYASLPNGAHAECGRGDASTSEQTEFPNLSSMEQVNHFCRRCTTLKKRRRPRFAVTRLSSSWGMAESSKTFGPNPVNLTVKALPRQNSAFDCRVLNTLLRWIRRS